MTWLLAGIFLIAAPYFVFVTVKSYSQLSSALRYTLMGLRLAVLILILMGLYGLHVPRQAAEKICNVFVVDASESISSQSLSDAEALVNRQLQSKGADDKAAVIVFGRSSVVVRRAGSAGTDLDIISAAQGISREQTCISQAIRIASGQFLGGYRNRITLLSDGRQNIGDAAGAAARSSAQIDTVKLETPSTGARIEEFTVSPFVRVGQPCKVKVRLAGNVRSGGEVQLLIDGKLSQTKTVQQAVEEPVTFEPAIQTEGTHTVTAVLKAGPRRAADKSATALVEVRGRIPVLLADTNPGELAPAAKVLREAGMKVTLADKAGFARVRGDLRKFDVVVLSDISAEAIGPRGAAAVRTYVRNGGGLIMAGGGNSFGAGGYYKTQVEEALPVYVDPYRQPVIQAVILIVDKSWSMGDMAGAEANKIDLIKEATIAAVTGLKERDYLAILSFDSGPHVIRPMQRIADDKQKIIETVATLGSFGLTDWYPAIGIAGDMLASLTKVNKNVILLSDGRPSAGVRDYRGIIADKLVRQKVKFSAIGCGKDVNERLLKQLVKIGKGEYYRIQDEKTVPKVKFKHKTDGASAAELLMVELPLKPKPANLSSALKKIPFHEAPELLGYNRVRPKELAEVNLVISRKDEPLLARWHYGAGRSVAFMSDIKGRWARRWIESWPEGYGRLLVQSVLWAYSDIDRGRIEIRRDEDATIAELEVFDTDSAATEGFVGSLVYADPAVKAKPAFVSNAIEFRRSGLNSYTAAIEAPAGAYLLRVFAKGAGSDRPIAAHGESFLPGRELHIGTADEATLKRISQVSGGKYYAGINDIAGGEAFRKSPMTQQVDLTSWLLMAAAIAFFAEVVVKRSPAVRELLAGRKS